MTAPHSSQILANARVMLGDAPDILPTSRDGKNDGWGGLAAVGLILLAVCVTVVVFLRNRRR